MDGAAMGACLMRIAYSVERGEAIVFVLGTEVEGIGRITEPNWARLDPSDCVWMVPGTEDDE